MKDPVIVDTGPTLNLFTLITVSPGGILLSIKISTISYSFLLSFESGAFFEYLTDVRAIVLMFFSLAIIAASTGA